MMSVLQLTVVIAVQLAVCQLYAQEQTKRVGSEIAPFDDRDCGNDLPAYRKMLARDSRNEGALTGVGICEARLGHPELAAAAFERVVGIDPNGWQGWLNLGTNRAALNQFELAVKDLEKATDLNPESGTAWHELGIARRRLGRNQESFRDLERAHELAPQDAAFAAAWRDGAVRVLQDAAELSRNGDFDQARSLLMKVRAPLETAASWHNLLGYVESKLGNAPAALEHLQMALQMEPKNEQFLMDIAEFLISNHAYDVARKFLEVGVAKHPDSARVEFGLAMAYQLDEKGPEAIPHLKHIIASHPDFDPAYTALGIAYENAGDWGALINLGRKLQIANAKNPLSLYLIGSGLMGQASNDRSLMPDAVKALEGSVRLDPTSARAHFMLARAYMGMGDYARAEKELRETLQLDPHRVEARYNLARIYQRTRRPELAKKEFDAFEEEKKLQVIGKKNELRLLVTEEPTK